MTLAAGDNTSGSGSKNCTGPGFEFIRGLETFSAFIGAIAGLIAIGLVIFKGGMLTQVVNGHESRLQAVESAGTVAARSHIDKDDDRDREMARQIQELRVTLGTITDLKVELKVMNTTLNNLLSAFDEHRKMKN